MTSGGTGCLAALLGFGFQGLNVALFIGPIFLVRMVGGPIILGQLIGLVLGSLLSLLMAFLPPRLVLKRVPRIGEETAD
jgi:hypothetical protein